MDQNQFATYLNHAGFQCLDQIKNSSIDLYLSTCGMQNCIPSHSFGPGIRTEYLLHFIMDGKGYYKVRGKVHTLKKGDFFLIWPNSQIYYEADKKNPWSYVWVGFQGVKAASYLNHAGLDADHLIGHLPDVSLIFTFVQQMMWSRQLTISNELKRDSMLYQILAALIDNHYQVLPKEDKYEYPYSVYVNQAMDYISIHYNESVKINDIAAYIGIDRSYLTQVFKKEIQISPQEYLIKYRMDQAEILLRDKNIKIKSVAQAVGYNDALTFSKMYKKIKGINPRETKG
jgi:AraC family transcriptional regulator of arabinose operon